MFTEARATKESLKGKKKTKLRKIRLISFNNFTN